MIASDNTYQRLFDDKIYLASNTKYTIWFYGLQDQLYYYYNNPEDIQKDHIFDGINFKFNGTSRTPLAGLIFE